MRNAGAIGLTQSLDAIQHWMIVLHDMIRHIIPEFGKYLDGGRYKEVLIVQYINIEMF